MQPGQAEWIQFWKTLRTDASILPDLDGQPTEIDTKELVTFTQGASLPAEVV